MIERALTTLPTTTPLDGDEQRRTETCIRSGFARHRYTCDYGAETGGSPRAEAMREYLARLGAADSEK
jgi:hypothetical protein